jgi:hypothetical protein
VPFTGRTTYFPAGSLAGMAEDVSDIIGMISPAETPLLDVLGDAPQPAHNVLHEWLEDQLNPNTIVSSTTNLPADTAVAMNYQGNAVAGNFSIGAIIKSNVTGEFLQVTALNGNTLSFTRGFGGTTAATITAGDTFFVISDAALEGADVVGDISRARSRKFNYTQIFKKDVIVSGTQEAVTHLGNIQDEMEYQKQQRIKESLRDLEKATINGILSGNTIGSATAYRTMKGLWAAITTNVTNVSSIGTLTPDVLNNIIAGPWGQGAVDLDLVIMDPIYKAVADNWNNTRHEIFQNQPNGFIRRVTYLEGTYGRHQLMLNRWMPAKSLIVLSTERFNVLPLQGREFQYIPVARTGDAEKGMILGEYTTEWKNEEGFAKAFG